MVRRSSRLQTTNPDKEDVLTKASKSIITEAKSNARQNSGKSAPKAQESRLSKGSKRKATPDPDENDYKQESNKKSRISNGISHEVTTSNQSYWLLKAEPESRIEKGKDVKFSIDDLQACTVPEPWTGVRNHVAKNNMLAMKQGDLAFFYHSSCKVPGVVGIMEIVKEATPDLSAFDSKDPYYDEKSNREKPRWFNVHVQFKTKFADSEKTTLTELRKHAVYGPLANMALLKQSRLSVSKVSTAEWNFILGLVGDLQYEDRSK